MSSWKSRSLRCLWIPCLLFSASILQGGVNEGGVLILHAEPGLIYTSDEPDYCGESNLSACSLAVTTVPYDQALHVFHVLAAFPGEAEPRLKAVSWGLAYDPSRIVLGPHGPCDPGTFLIPDAGWPASGTGIGMSWGTPRSETLNELYWFSGYGYQQGQSADTASVMLIPHPIQGGLMVDDREPPEEDTIAGFGRLGFGRPGYLPCPDAEGDQADGGTGTPEGGEDGSAGEGPVLGDLTFVELNADDASSFVAASRELERDHHMRVLVGMAPDGLICRMDEASRELLAEDTRVRLVTSEAIPGLPPVEAGDLRPGDPGFAARSWNEMLSFEAPVDSGLKVDEEPFPGCLEDDGRIGPSQNPEHQTSVYMMGRVGVSVLFMESLDDGPCDPPNSYTENWTQGEINLAITRIAIGLRALADLSPDADLSFLLRETPVLWTSVEPVQLANSDTTWRAEAMDQMGMPPGTWTNRNWALNNSRRADPDAPFDWWFTMYVIRDVCDEDHRFANGQLSTAYLHGPQFTLLCWNSVTYPPEWIGNIAAHETCHIFGAADEYSSNCSCPSVTGTSRWRTATAGTARSRGSRASWMTRIS